MQGWTATTRHGVTRKRSTKRLKHTGNLFTKNLNISSGPGRSKFLTENSLKMCRNEIFKYIQVDLINCYIDR